MITASPFTIYNASAGSGKTFTLVKHYLKLLIASGGNQAFRSILALTFTNKAVAEMKTRIIETLQVFADYETETEPPAMFGQIMKELKIDAQELKLSSDRMLKSILHNYGAFDISTIDRFNHRLIRTFAHDLKLPMNFEVELDTEYQLSKAVDRLIDKAGTNVQLTNLLVDFAIEKADDDRSWDISYDFNSIARLLITENDLPYIKRLENKTIEDFKNLQKLLFQKAKIAETYIVSEAKAIMELISANGLTPEDFSGKYLYNHFSKLSEGNFNLSLEAKWQENLLEGKPPYPKRVNNEIANTIDAISQRLAEAFSSTKKSIAEMSFFKNALKNIIPLSVLNEINKSLNELKAEENFILISEFNSIINTEIKAQPAPFIYERIGEKYRNYFIDEFQDTSTLQWENLIPLIDNAVSSQNLKGEIGKAIIVGDAKQSIYRWRGGKAEQFIELYQESTFPLSLKQEIHNLPTNFRSSKAIIDFNNSFFEHLSSFAFSSETHRQTYGIPHQQIHSQDEGFVEISFLDSSEETEIDIQYAEQVLNTIESALKNGFSLGDICIIVRKSKEGVSLANFLSEKNVKIVSSETLLLKNSAEVVFINDIMKLALEPENLQVKLNVLDFIANHLKNIDDVHQFYETYIEQDTNHLFQEINFDFDLDAYSSLPIYEATEMSIRAFGLDNQSNAFLQFYLDEILAFSTKNQSNFKAFQVYWERKSDKLSIVSPQGQNAVEIMTIHKSKGLEFPVVIFPYANQKVYFDLNPKVWFPVDETFFSGFSELYLNLNKELANYNKVGKLLYDAHQAELELDSINLLYVALTRSSQHLYIISDCDFSKSSNENLKTYSGLFINYLKSIDLWNDHQTHYQFGTKTTEIEKYPQTRYSNEIKLISTPKEAHQLHIVTKSGKLWDTAQQSAIEKGNLLHDLMATIETPLDVESSLQKFKSQGSIDTEQMTLLREKILSIINHPRLKNYFQPGLQVFNEKAIITSEGTVLRPDRIVFLSDTELILIDYKTGLSNPKHTEQLFAYQEVLESMGFRVKRKILIYIDTKITIKEF